MSHVRLGAVGYLNARPLVFGLDQSSRFDLRFDVPSRCADLLHGGGIDVGLIPSIEYLRHPSEVGSSSGQYLIAPDLAIASHGQVASVALYTTKPLADVRAIAMDVSSRTSVALVRVLCARHFKIAPRLESHGPDLTSMLADCDAALLIGDNALFADPSQLTLTSQPSTARSESASAASPLPTVDWHVLTVEKIDLGAVWTATTGLPFVWAFWAGRPGAVTAEDVAALQESRDAGVNASEAIARDYFPGAPDRQRVGAKYLRDNIRYTFGPDERAGLELFYRYAAEAGVVNAPAALRFYCE